MLMTTRRSTVAAAATLFTVLASAALGQEVQVTSNPAPSQSAGQAGVQSADDDKALVLVEPDFKVINLSSTLRLPLHGSNFQLTHRFNGNLLRGSFGDQLGDLFGLDQGAAVGFEYRYGIARHLQVAAYRTAIDKTIQFSGQYDAVRQGGSMPVSLSGLVSVEGTNNFRERYSPAAGLVVSRFMGTRLAVYTTPVWVHNTAALLNTSRDTFFVGLGGRVRLSSSVYLVAEVAPRAGGYSPDKPAWGFAIEKRAGGHMFQINFNNGQGTTFGQVARGGFSDSLYLGFNLARKFF
jgi:hypothetical protein